MSTALEQFLALPSRFDGGGRDGLTSVCSAHPLVIEAALIEAQAAGALACIEATCNQVNQDGGYTGMTPADFRAFVIDIADKVSFPVDRILFGGDHLGPNPWRKLPADAAMAKAVTMTRAYASAGFGKIHLDASMSCADDPSPLAVETIAGRAARLAIAAEEGARAGKHPAPAYIIGTEVPVPGGASEEIESLAVTTPADATLTLEVHRAAFEMAGIAIAYERVVGLVVQPGVEFGNANVIGFSPEAAAGLSAWRKRTGGLVFEAHSTDYQTGEALGALVDGGFCILKVGPGLTFALREALYGLDQVAGVLAEGYAAGTLPEAMERLMLSEPGDWSGYYHGAEREKGTQRHYSYSDRIRYYWTRKAAKTAIDQLMSALANLDIDEPLISQFLARLYPDVVAGRLKPRARDLLIAAIRCALAPYTSACAAQPQKA